jgi:hypothetical protein
MAEHGRSLPPRRRQLEMLGRVVQQQHEQERADHGKSENQAVNIGEQ